jgi:hypothetical protein
MEKSLFNQDLSCGRVTNKPYSIYRVVYNALSPLEQLAARALEQTGKVRIIDDSSEESG